MGGRSSAIEPEQFEELCEWLIGERGMRPWEILRLTWRQLRRIYLREKRKADPGDPCSAPGLSGAKAQFWRAYSYKRVLDREERVIRAYRDDEVEAMWKKQLVWVRGRAERVKAMNESIAKKHREQLAELGFAFKSNKG